MNVRYFVTPDRKGGVVRLMACLNVNGTHRGFRQEVKPGETFEGYTYAELARGDVTQIDLPVEEPKAA